MDCADEREKPTLVSLSALLRGMSCHSSLAPPMSPRSPPAESNRSKLRRVMSVWHFFKKSPAVGAA